MKRSIRRDRVNIVAIWMQATDMDNEYIKTLDETTEDGLNEYMEALMEILLEWRESAKDVKEVATIARAYEHLRITRSIELVRR